jgi:hypothetical protein
MSGSTAGRIVTRSKVGRKTARPSRAPRAGCPAIVQLCLRAGHCVAGTACRETSRIFLKSLRQTLCERWPCASGMRSAVEQAGELCRDSPRAEGGRHINFGARVSGLVRQRSPCVGVWLLAFGTTVRGYPAPKLFFALTLSASGRGFPGWRRGSRRVPLSPRAPAPCRTAAVPSVVGTRDGR